MVKSSVTRTACDALLAKWSALNAGYTPVNVNNKVYHDLLQQMASLALSRYEIRQKRQSPLVNAGYAARIASMTFAVQSFVSFHSEAIENSNNVGVPRPSSTLQVVILGCGLDVLGLWAHSLSPDHVRVFELDTLGICEAKKEILLSSGLLKPSQHNMHNVVIEGNIDFGSCRQDVSPSGDKDEQQGPPNYTLSACDLRDLASVQNVLSTLDTTLPTLVLSELVLVYLGRRGIDDILRWCALHVCVAPGSAIVAYEPLGASKEFVSIRSVVDGYKQQYCRQFREKLQRGTAQRPTVGAKDFDDDDEFHPLEHNPPSVEARLEHAGFPLVYACLAGTAVASATYLTKQNGEGAIFSSQEPFDEHAALTLHLCSYALVCAFSGRSELELMQSMCPWSNLCIYGLPVDSLNKRFLIRPIESSHQIHAQELFIKTYADLANEYPSVKKMVKTALKTDLSFTMEDTPISAIGSRYKGWGGAFIVAVDVDTSDNNALEPPECRVLGCVGIRSCQKSEGVIRGGQTNTFEIHRLCVHPDARGRGIGKALLETAGRFVQHKQGTMPYQLVATTPALLTVANQLYQSSGFIVQSEQTIGRIVIYTYVKNYEGSDC